MVDVIAARKAVLPEILDLWSRGPSLRPLLTDLGQTARGGGIVDIPALPATQINASETANPNSVTPSRDQLIVNRRKFINDEVTQTQMAQLMNGGGNFARQLAERTTGDLRNDTDRDTVRYLLSDVAGLAPGNHFNLDGNALQDRDVNRCVAAMRSQDGVANTNTGLFWLTSPEAEGEIKSVADLNPADALAVAQAVGQESRLGLSSMGFLNGIPVFMHNAVPGMVESLRQRASFTSSDITSNVLTLSGVAVETGTPTTNPAGHGFVVGQQVYTTGATANPSLAAPGEVTAVTATTITITFTSGDDAANGAGVVLSATSMTLLCYRPWIFYANDGVVPFQRMVERSDAAGWAWQMTEHYGREAHAGSVKVLHTQSQV